jgi:hypothetical protein
LGGEAQRLPPPLRAPQEGADATQPAACAGLFSPRTADRRLTAAGNEFPL